MLFAAMAAAVPAHAETLPIEAVYPAGSDNLAILNTLRMGSFNGRDGSSLALELEQQLRNVSVRGEAYYQIFVGGGGPRADGTVTGSAYSSVENNVEIVQETECVAKNDKGKCIEKRVVNIRCTRRSVTLTYTLSVVSPRGERLYSMSKPSVTSNLICPQTYNVAPVEVVIASLISNAARELRFEFAPAQVRTDIRVKEGTSGLQGAAKKTFKNGIAATKRNVASACKLWTEVDYLVPNHAPTLFNLGLCAESDRDYDKAEQLYRRTAELDRSERYATESLERLARRRKAEQQLAMHASRRTR
ncbi:hypothetical protein TS85_05355 [Sphingomonas hengshuiensis]|uniref:Tetratricopeptide repeat protein n=1 Tax=Sphingomonas hengshuiensis TaxID=1609977 RepID=A0A7U4J6U9_9SPHN|nr:hypothetical protein TS85_05355 [Sphingomonas hengshuiensis]